MGGKAKKGKPGSGGSYKFIPCPGSLHFPVSSNEWGEGECQCGKVLKLWYGGVLPRHKEMSRTVQDWEGT